MRLPEIVFLGAVILVVIVIPIAMFFERSDHAAKLSSHQTFCAAHNMHLTLAYGAWFCADARTGAMFDPDYMGEAAK